jgi:nicotinamidase-related amidase
MSNVLTQQAGGRTVASQPYAWPYHGSLEIERCALVACLDGRWRAPAAESDASDERLGRLGAALRAAGGLVVAVTVMPQRGGGALAPRAPQLDADLVLAAGGLSGFYGSPLDALLRDSRRTDLLLAGWGLEGPVHSTMRAANDRGYECLLVPDACTPIEPELAGAACSMVRFSGGIFGAYADTDSVVAALDDARTARSDT